MNTTITQATDLLRAGRIAEAQAVANDGLRTGDIAPGLYIQLARWSEGRPSSLDDEVGPR